MALDRAAVCQGTWPARLSGDERQPRWEAAGWKLRVAVPGLQLAGGISEERDEPGEALIEGFPRSLAKGVEERRWRARDLRGTVQRIFGENRLHADDGSIGLSPSESGIRLDGIHQSGDPRSVEVPGEMRPTGNRRQHDGFLRGES